MKLTDEQQSALTQLKQRVGTISPDFMNSDHELLRWLKARNFDVDRAERMLLRHLEWRKEWEIDTILEWTPPEVLTKYYPVGHSGYDKDGDPVWVIRYGLCDIRGMLSSVTKRELIKFCLFVLETSMADMRKKSEGREDPMDKQSLILDLENFTLRQFVWKPALDVAFAMAPMFDANYPELLKCVYVINAPMIFSIAYNMMKTFFHEVTLKKIIVHGSSGWKDVLLKNIDADQFPAQYGGTMTDPDGDEKCPSKICPGGNIPESYYLKNKKTDRKLHDSLQTLVLPTSSKKEFTLKVELPGTELRWLFHTDDYDVGFGISRIALPSGVEEELIPSQRVDSHIIPEEGSLICTNPGEYKFTFDNEFSYMRSKQVYYSIDLKPPTEHTKF